jgi:hypothetical protein
MNDEYETRVIAIRRYLEGEPPARNLYAFRAKFDVVFQMEAAI